MRGLTATDLLERLQSDGQKDSTGKSTLDRRRGDDEYLRVLDLARGLGDGPGQGGRRLFARPVLERIQANKDGGGVGAEREAASVQTGEGDHAFNAFCVFDQLRSAMHHGFDRTGEGALTESVGV